MVDLDGGLGGAIDGALDGGFDGGPMVVLIRKDPIVHLMVDLTWLDGGL